MPKLKGAKLTYDNAKQKLKNVYSYQFYGPIYVGSNAQELYVAYDTGSDVILHSFLTFFSGLSLNRVAAKIAKGRILIH